MVERWCVEIQGNLGDLETIRISLINTNFHILKKFEKYLIESTRFDQYEKLEDIMDEGERIVTIINGIASINLNLKGNIKIVGGVRIIEETQKIQSSHKQLSYKGNVTNITNLNDPEIDDNSIEKWIILAEENNAIRKVFRLLNYGLDSYDNTYRIYEIICEDLGEEYIEHLEVTEIEINRFTASVNLPKYAGDLARHGYIKNERRSHDFGKNYRFYR